MQPLHRCLLACLLIPGLARADEHDRLPVGVQPDGRIVVPTNQILTPAGKQITFAGRPVDLALADGGRTLIAKSMKELVFIDVETATIREGLVSPVAFSVVGLLVHGDAVYATDARNHVRVARRQADGSFAWAAPLALIPPKVGKEAHPAGICRVGDELWVTSTRGNSVQRIHLSRGQAEQLVPVGVAPFTVVAASPERLYVSNWGGDHPREDEPQSDSSGTPARIDSRTGIGNDGTVSVLGAVQGGWKALKSIRVGLHPSGMVAGRGGKLLYVANANSDSVSVIDTRTDTVVETIRCRPERRLPFGSGTNALALSPDGTTLYAANGTNNCVAVIRLGAKAVEGGADGRPAASTVAGLIPTGWYPGAVLVSEDGKRLFVANIKGHGSLSQPRPKMLAKNSHDHLGSVSIIDVPDDAQLARYTAQVHANNRLAYSLAGLEKPRPDAAPVPVPARHGEPSVIEHVIYVIKENRTYDQVFGDMKEGNGLARLAIFGEKVTPNHHALARQFTLFDNFYCSGVLSADGHSWTDLAYVTDYLERSFGQFTRSYPDDGSDPLAYAPTGFLWDNALAHKKTFRNYGEFTNKVFAPKGTKWLDSYRDYQQGTQNVRLTVKANLKSLEPYTHPRFPWFPLLIPDVYRARMFIEDLQAFEKKGALPNLMIVTLPCNHTNGTKPDWPTPRAMVADNDLALGQIVEAVSKSKFWPKTCILVVEDDPQNGYDHVDGHRTVALVISPYTKRRHVDHTNYNQTGMVKTIELMLGLPPMNQMDLAATPLRNCFQEKPDVTPYACLPSNIPLDEMNPPVEKLNGQARVWARKSQELDFEDGDAADEDTLNRILWHSVRGDEPYPEQFTNKGRN